FVADFIGEANWLAGTVEAVDPDSLTVATDLGSLIVARRAGDSTTWSSGVAVDVGIRPEAIRFGAAPDARNVFTAMLRRSSYLGEVEQYGLGLPSGLELKAWEQNPERPRAVGVEVTVHIPPSQCLVFRADTQAR
ncbi:MAG TPA: TOBE domain-containing protein, partial [Pirellulaceae bacterium]|nr:TOBE domain-containing protein [Pirellulaceae bacterium]